MTLRDHLNIVTNEERSTLEMKLETFEQEAAAGPDAEGMAASTLERFQETRLPESGRSPRRPLFPETILAEEIPFDLVNKDLEVEIPLAPSARANQARSSPSSGAFSRKLAHVYLGNKTRAIAFTM
jgi:hypothetical protein